MWPLGLPLADGVGPADRGLPVSRLETQHVLGLQAEWILGRRGRALTRRDSGEESRWEVMSTSGGYSLIPFVSPSARDFYSDKDPISVERNDKIQVVDQGPAKQSGIRTGSRLLLFNINIMQATNVIK